jgi:putative peptide zinc metalloprotease protein
MAVAAAGMYFEWIIALAAVGIWSCSTSAEIRHLCVYIVSLATLTTVLFNANPLCRLDGYYLLSDSLAWPNLASQGRGLAANWFGWLLGAEVKGEPRISPRRYWFGLAYGVAAFLWRQIALLTMASMVILSYEGLGALLVAGTLLAWYAPAAGSRQSKFTTLRGAWTFLNFRQVLRLTTMVGSLAVLSWFMPWPLPLTAPGLVENVVRYVVRARSPGHVIEVCVKDGDWVDAGHKLAILRNDELAFELADLELEVARGEAKLRSLHSKRQLVDFQVEEQRQAALTERLTEQRRKLADLTLLAPAAGRVTARRLADLPGSFLAEGAELCEIDESRREFHLSIAQQDVHDFVEGLGKPITVRFPGRTVTGVLTSLEPQASTSLPDPAFSAASGGPLAVVPGDAQQQANGKNSADWKLNEPRVTGTVALETADQSTLFSGQRGSAALHSPGRTIATVIGSWCGNWLSSLRRRSVGSTH